MLALNLWLKTLDGYASNQKNSSTTKIGEHIPCKYSMSNIWALNHIENNHTLSRGEDCMKKFFSSLRDHTKNKLNFEKKKNVTVNRRRAKTTLRFNKLLHLWKKNLKKFVKSKNYRKVRDHWHYAGKYRGAVHRKFRFKHRSLRFKVLNEIPVIFHSGSSSDFYLIIKKLANEFEEQFQCLGKKTK